MGCVFLGAALALLSKEQGATVLGACLVEELLYGLELFPGDLLLLLLAGPPVRGLSREKAANPGHRPDARSIPQCAAPAQLPAWPAGLPGAVARVCGLALISVVLLAWRLSLNHDQAPVFNENEIPAAFAEKPVQRMTQHYYVLLNALLLTFPFQLCHDWSHQSIPLVVSAWDPRNLVTVGFYLGLAALAIWVCLPRRLAPLQGILRQQGSAMALAAQIWPASLPTSDRTPQRRGRRGATESKLLCSGAACGDLPACI
jgi:hypothetical protein